MYTYNCLIDFLVSIKTGSIYICYQTCELEVYTIETMVLIRVKINMDFRYRWANEKVYETNFIIREGTIKSIILTSIIDKITQKYTF
jgi:hypothetical protein